jgi:hypothetical protein
MNLQAYTGLSNRVRKGVFIRGLMLAAGARTYLSF